MIAEDNEIFVWSVTLEDGRRFGAYGNTYDEAWAGYVAWAQNSDDSPGFNPVAGHGPGQPSITPLRPV